MNDPHVLTPIVPNAGPMTVPPFPQPPLQIQLPRELVDMMQLWPGHVDRTKQLELRLGSLEGQVQSLPARLTTLEGQKTSGAPAHAKPYLALVAWACMLAGILLTLGGQFLWAHW